MNSRHLTGAAAAAVLLAGTVFAAERLKSGPQVGDRVQIPFHPLNVTGSQEGKKACLV